MVDERLCHGVGVDVADGHSFQPSGESVYHREDVALPGARGGQWTYNVNVTCGEASGRWW